MKNLFSKLLVLIPTLALAGAVQARGIQGADNSPSTPKLVTLLFELQDLPGRDTAGSLWEVSYQWRIVDQQDFDQWLANGENPAEVATLGMLLSRQSFTRRNLSNADGRRFQLSIPVKGDLLSRLRNAGQRRQVILLNATVRIHDAKLGTDVVKKMTPVWGQHFYRDGLARVRMELTPEGNLRWFTADAAPWAGGQGPGVRRTRVP